MRWRTRRKNIQDAVKVMLWSILVTHILLPLLLLLLAPNFRYELPSLLIPLSSGLAYYLGAEYASRRRH